MDTVLEAENNIYLTNAKKEDAKSVFDLYQEDMAELKKVFSFVNEDLTLEDEESFFENPGKDHPFVIRFNNEICGYAVLYDFKDSNKSVSILYYVNSRFRGNGIASIATTRLLDYAFEDLEANKVDFFINTDNINSLKLVRRLGIRYEGTLLDNDYSNGEYKDQDLYSILKREYDFNFNKKRVL